MRTAVRVCALLALLTVRAGAQSDAAAGESLVEVRSGDPLTVECALRPEQPIEWRLGGRTVPADMHPAGESTAAGILLRARLHAASARPHHAGLYTCSRVPGHGVRVRLLPPAPPAPTPDSPGEHETEPSNERNAGGAASVPSPLVYDIGRPFVLSCDTAARVACTWTKNGTTVNRLSELRGRYQVEREGTAFRLTERATELDRGEYACGECAWRLRARPVARLPPDVTVVEGQMLRLACRVPVATPPPAVTWTYRNASGGNATDVAAAFGARLQVERGERGSELVLAATRRGDAGEFSCRPADAAGVPASSTVRVRDRYAALWPLLGIVAEALLLCAIILVCEKRRPRAELDDGNRLARKKS